VAARLRRFVKLWIELFSKHGLLDHASAIAFAVLKALVPLTLLGLALLGALGQQKVWENTLAPGIEPELQPPTFHAIDAAVERIFSTSSAGLIAFAAVLAAWYISGAVRGLMTGINKIYECPETRPWKVRYAISIGLGLAIAVCVIGRRLQFSPARSSHGTAFSAWWST